VSQQVFLVLRSHSRSLGKGRSLAAKKSGAAISFDPPRLYRLNLLAGSHFHATATNIFSGFDGEPFFPQVRPLMKSVKVPALELFLHEMIPLAKAMGVSVEMSDEQKLVLIAPLEQNKNSLNTAFGGSLVSLATLAGYGVVWELMRNETGEKKAEWRIVVKESRAAYRRPVIGDLRAICERPAKAALDEFKAALQRYGQAKLKLRTRIIEDGNTAVDVQAAYVVVAR
jgi:thioesterase domain-containing protein